jgi:hypothetical protein
MKISVPLFANASRLVAADANATTVPSAEMLGEIEPSLPRVPLLIETYTEVPVAALQRITSHFPNPSTVPGARFDASELKAT